MRLTRRNFTVGLSSVSALALMSTQSGALAMAAIQVAHRILAADKLSYLAEKSAKAVVLMKLGADIERDLVELQESHDEFDDILLGFKTGQGASGVEKERFVSVQKAIKEVEALWAPFRIAVEEIVAAKAVDDAHFHSIVDNDEALDKACHHVVRELEDAYGDVDIDLAYAVALDFAGRQRTLTQVTCKEIALAAMGKDLEEHHAKFKKNAVKFGKIIDALINGGNGMITMSGPPNSDAMTSLQTVQTHWEKLQPLIATLDAADQPALEDVVNYCHEMEAVAAESEDVTKKYESAVAATS